MAYATGVRRGIAGCNLGRPIKSKAAGRPIRETSFEPGIPYQIVSKCRLNEKRENNRNNRSGEGFHLSSKTPLMEEHTKTQPIL